MSSGAWTAVGTIALAVATVAAVFINIIITVQDRKRAAANLTAERKLADARLREERDHAERVRRRERQARPSGQTLARMLASRSAVPTHGWLVVMTAFPMLAAACALAGLPSAVDSRRRRFLAERQRELGIRIPAAVAEWYAIDGVVEHFVQSSGPIIVRREELGLAADGRDLAAGRLLLASDYQGCCDWVVDLAPTFAADWDVPLPGLEPLPEDQAVVAERADPPVRLSVAGDPGETWSLATPHFSAYVHAEAWDIAFLAQPHHDGVVAFDGALSGKSDLMLLRRDFVPGPRSYGWAGCFGAPGLVIHRFERPGQRVRVAAHPQRSEWWLAADSAQNLERLVALLSKSDDAFARKLHPAGKRSRASRSDRS